MNSLEPLWSSKWKRQERTPQKHKKGLKAFSEEEEEANHKEWSLRRKKERNSLEPLWSSKWKRQERTQQKHKKWFESFSEEEEEQQQPNHKEGVWEERKKGKSCPCAFFEGIFFLSLCRSRTPKWMLLVFIKDLGF